MVLRCARFARGSSAKNRFITFLQRFVQFVSRRAHTKLILGQQHEGDSGHVGFHHRKKFRRDLLLTDGEVWLPIIPEVPVVRSAGQSNADSGNEIVPDCETAVIRYTALWDYYSFLLRTLKNAFAKNQLQRRFLEVLSLEGYCTDCIWDG